MPGADVTSGRLNLDGLRQDTEQVTKQFGPPMVAITLRENQRPGNRVDPKKAQVARPQPLRRGSRR